MRALTRSKASAALKENPTDPKATAQAYRVLGYTTAGKAEVSASETLKVAISGAGKVTYHGNPTLEQHISGAGSVRRRD